MHFGHGQADAVKGDGAFVGDVMGEIRRQPDLEPMIRAALLEGENAHRAIHVSLDEMTAESVVRGE